LTETEIISESVKAGAAIALMNAFPGIAVYREQMTEPEFPHFFIDQLTVAASEERKRKWWLRYLMTIRYREASDTALIRDIQSRLDATGLAMLARLETISLGAWPTPFRNPRTEKNDNVLHYFCNFEFQVTKPEIEAVKQQTLNINTILERK